MDSTSELEIKEEIIESDSSSLNLADSTTITPIKCEATSTSYYKREYKSELNNIKIEKLYDECPKPLFTTDMDSKQIIEVAK